MANVINKNNKILLYSVHTPGYNTKEWIINPSLPGCEKKYWKIEGELVKEMTSQEKAVIDGQELNVLKELRKSETDDEANRRIGTSAQAGDIGTFLNIPGWKKDNYILKANELIEKKAFGGTLTAQEQATLDALKNIWSQAKDIRNRSDVIKDDISALSNIDDVKSYDIKHSIRWTE